jgi:hypothetical protein
MAELSPWMHVIPVKLAVSECLCDCIFVALFLYDVIRDGLHPVVKTMREKETNEYFNCYLTTT